MVIIFYHERGRVAMSNEELTVLIQGGERDELMELWGQVRRMALKEAARWVVYRSNGAELEDLEQAALIALLRAADSYDPAAGAQFSTWYYPIMKDEFQRATGRRTMKQRCDPLQSAVSLDVQVGEDEDCATLGELQADPDAARALEDAEERIQQERLHVALESAIATLPPDLQAVVRGHYFRGEVVDANAHSKALRLLRAPKCSRALREYL